MLTDMQRFTTNTNDGFARGGSGVVHVIDATLKGDVSVLAQTLGDTAYNRYAANGTVGPYVSDGTVWRDAITGAIKTGAATLAAGTVTVANTLITANSVIWLAQRSAGGTPGAVFVSARVPAASFTITSTSATDTSAVRWDIVTY
jgi:hypothetical protein